MKKKLIEVALPLDAVNRESVREKSIRQGHPATLHIWWARRPLAACRTVLLASILDDPASSPDRFPTPESQDAERKRLFELIERAAKWENASDRILLDEIYRELAAQGEGIPPVHDPFAGGGAIPLEAGRLGLDVLASDLNPVPVLINSAQLDYPRRFRDRPPVAIGADPRLMAESWTGANGLAADIRHYGQRLVDQAKAVIGHHYPTVRTEAEGEATAIAWLWARTVECPNPACRSRAPLVRSLWLSRRRGQLAWLDAVPDPTRRRVDFEVRHGDGSPGPGSIGRNGGTCFVCGSHIPLDTIRVAGHSGQIGNQLICTVAQGARGRIFVDPDASHEEAAQIPRPEDAPNAPLPQQGLGFRVRGYGFNFFDELFSPRQLTALTTSARLLPEVREQVLNDAQVAGFSKDPTPLAEGGHGAVAYADAVATYLAMGVSKAADLASTLCHWQSNAEQLKLAPTFSRPTLSMSWDWAEGNPFSDMTGNFFRQFELVANVVERLPTRGGTASVAQLDAAAISTDGKRIIATDPPYYDNIGYADLSDFFYMWLRRMLSSLHPNLFSTLLTPKAEELIADPHRQGGSRSDAALFFERGMAEAFARMRQAQHPDYPLTLFYAFKQSEEDGSGGGVASTGWQTMLQALLGAGLMITGTWPMRTERSGRPRDNLSNALASSIVLVCRPRPVDAPMATRREFMAALRAELPEALTLLQHGNIAPVDLAQAAIGPGMAVFSRYSRVIEADGEAMTVRGALALINQALDERLAEQDSDFDPETRWAVAWFEQYGFNEGPYGVAETLATAKNVAVRGLVGAGIIVAPAGKVRLLERSELPPNWDPRSDLRLTVWEIVQHLMRVLDQQGEEAGARLLRNIGGMGDAAKELAYRLFSICERKGWAAEALAFNGLIASWPEMVRLMSHTDPVSAQGALNV